MEPVEAAVSRLVTPVSTAQGEVTPPGKHRSRQWLFLLYQAVLPSAFLFFVFLLLLLVFLSPRTPGYAIGFCQSWEQRHVSHTSLVVLSLTEDNSFLTQQPLCNRQVSSGVN